MTQVNLQQPYATISRIQELIGELSESRSRIEDFTRGLVTDYDAIGTSVAQTVAKVGADKQASARGQEELTDLRDQVVQLHSELQKARQQLSDEKDTASKQAAQLDEDTRQLLDDLVQERDKLKTELESEREFNNNRNKLRGDLNSMHAAMSALG